MKVDPRIVAAVTVAGAGAVSTTVALALYLPAEGFLVLLFPSFLLWLFVPFLLLRIWRSLKKG